MERECLECGRELIGRADKKFCTDQCRTAYNNKQESKNSVYIRKVNLILKKNRRILENLNPDGRIKIHRDELLLKGFDFNYVTNVFLNSSLKTYRYCYDQAYMEMEDGWYLIMKKAMD